jgi:hypothetical protein
MANLSPGLALNKGRFQARLPLCLAQTESRYPDLAQSQGHCLAGTASRLPEVPENREQPPWVRQAHLQAGKAQKVPCRAERRPETPRNCQKHKLTRPADSAHRVLAVDPRRADSVQSGPRSTRRSRFNRNLNIKPVFQQARRGVSKGIRRRREVSNGASRRSRLNSKGARRRSKDSRKVSSSVVAASPACLPAGDPKRFTASRKSLMASKKLL